MKCDFCGQEACTVTDYNYFTLGGGAHKGLPLPGVIRYLLDAGVDMVHSVYTGISIGSIVGWLFTNGKSPEEIQEIFYKKLHISDKTTPSRLLQGTLSGLKRWDAAFRPGLLDSCWLIKDIQQDQNDSELSMRANLFTLSTRLPGLGTVIMTGADNADRIVTRGAALVTNANPVVAVASAIAVPAMFRPVIARVEGRRVPLIDGGLRNPHPSWIAPIDNPVIAQLFHGKLVDRVFEQKPEAIVLPVGDNRVPPFTHLTPKLCKEQFERGRKIAAELLQPRIDAGELAMVSAR